ncbi:MAG: ROK family protein, partial [Clostridia bacterium]|nr:ROK family protein [Clostridia bacterium]
MKIGIDLGGSHIAIGVIDGNGRILEKVEKRITSTEKKQIKKVIEEYIVKNVDESVKKYKITEIGIAIPGTVNSVNGTVVKSVNLGLKDYEIVKELKKHIDIPIVIKNDAKCSALAELKYGSLKNYKRSMFITLGTGIGGAIIIDGKLLDCGEMPGCEIGHMVINKEGIECQCGRKGCFEKYASMKALKNNLRKVLGVDEKVSGKELFEIIRNNKPENENYEKIENTVQEFITNLSIGIANLINIFEPEIIGIGGSFVHFEEVLMPRLKKELLSKNL